MGTVGRSGGGSIFAEREPLAMQGAKNGLRIKCGMTPNQIRQGIGPIGTGQAVGGEEFLSFD